MLVISVTLYFYEETNFAMCGSSSDLLHSESYKMNTMFIDVFISFDKV